MFSFVKSMLWFIKKNWYFYISIVIVGIGISLANLLPATIISSLTDSIDNDSVTSDFLLKNILLYYLLIMFLIYIVSTTKRVLQNRLKVRLYYALQVRYMENILVQDATFFEHFQAGDLLTSAQNPVDAELAKLHDPVYTETKIAEITGIQKQTLIEETLILSKSNFPSHYNQVNSGSILYLEENLGIKYLKVLLDQIRYKGLEIVSISSLISESN